MTAFQNLSLTKKSRILRALSKKTVSEQFFKAVYKKT